MRLRFQRAAVLALSVLISGASGHFIDRAYAATDGLCEVDPETSDPGTLSVSSPTTPLYAKIEVIPPLNDCSDTTVTDDASGLAAIVTRIVNDDTPPEALSGFWETKDPICAVVVKAGNAEKIYTYDNATSGSWSTSGLTNRQGKQQGLSNIQFYECEEEEGGKVKLFKTTINATGYDQVVGENKFELAVGGQTATATVTGFVAEVPADPSQISLTPGDYTVSETLPPNPQNIPDGTSWELDSIQCVAENGPEIDGDGTFTLAAGQTISCVVTNKLVKVRADKGSITIKKEKDYGGSVQDSPTFAVKLDDVLVQASNDAAPDGLKIGEMTDPIPVAAGLYTISETDLPEGWELSQIDCGDNGTTSASSLEISIDADEDAVCIVKNRKKERKTGSIKIIKEVIGGAGEEFTFSLKDPEGNLETLYPDNILGNGDDATATDLPTGEDYKITETPVPGFSTTVSGDCKQYGDTVKVEVKDGEESVCKFTNFKKKDDRADDVTKLYVHRRVDNLLTHGPDRARLLRRLQDGQQPSLKDEPLKFGAAHTGSDTTLMQAAGSSRLGANGISVSENASDASTGFGTGIGARNNYSSDGQLLREDGVPWVYDRTIDTHDQDRPLYGASPASSGLGSNSMLSGVASQLSALGSGQTAFKFGTSLKEVQASLAANDAAQARKKVENAGLGFESLPANNPPQTLRQGIDIWVEGHISRYDDSTGGINREGDFKILYVGADYAVAPGVLLGALVQIDDTKEDVDDSDSANLKGEVEGTGWMAGPYIGIRLADNLFFDARAAYGQSDNDIWLYDDDAGKRRGSFDTDRWLASATLTGNQYIGPWRLSPQIGLAYGNEWYDDYQNNLGQTVEGHDISIGRLTVAAEVGYRIDLENGTMIEPHVSLTGIVNFATDELEINGALVETDDTRAKIEGGVLIRTPSGWGLRAAGSYDGIGGDDFEAYSGSLWVNVPLN
jgi:outer membrane autotransporter protein